MPFEIFLSHNHRDLAWCEHVRQAAAVVGVATYLAEHNAMAGVSLATKVQQAIRRSQAVVVMISDNSVAAPYVQQEIGFALASKKIVVPLVQPGISGPALAMLNGVEYIPFDFDAPDEGLKVLNANLTRLVQRQRQRDQEATAMVVMACAAVLLIALTTTSVT